MATRGRDVIQQRVELVGADEIKQQFKEMGEEGENSAQKLEKAFNAPSGPAQATAQAVANVRNSISPLSTEAVLAAQSMERLGQSVNLTGPLATLTSSFQGIGTALGVMGIAFGAAAVAVGATVVAFLPLGRAAANAANEIDKASKNAGISADRFQTFARGAQRAGIDSKDLASDLAKVDRELGNIGLKASKAGQEAGGAVRRLTTDTQSLGITTERVGDTIVTRYNDIGVTVRRGADGFKEATTNVSEFEKKAKELGVSLRDSNGRLKDSETAIKEIAIAIAKIPDSASRRSLIDAFGLKTLADLVEKGVKDIEKKGADAKKTLDNFTDDQRAAAKRYEDSADSLSAAWTDFKNAFGIAFTPPAAGLNEWASKEVEDASRVLNEFAKNGAGAGFKAILDSFVGAITGSKPVIGAALGDAFADLTLPKESKGLFDQLVGNDLEAAKKAFTDLSTIVSTGIGAITQATGPALEGVAQSGSQSALTLSQRWNAGIEVMKQDLLSFQEAGSSLWTSIGESWSSGIEVMKQDLTTLTESSGEFWTTIGELWTSGIEVMRDDWAQIEQFTATTWDQVAAGAQGFWATLEGLWTSGVASLQGAFQSLVSGVQSMWDSLVSSITSGLATIKGIIDSVVSSVMSAISSLASAISDAVSSSEVVEGSTMDGFVPEYATGGYVSGPGSSRSDSIMARLSNGEFVMQARAVRRYGTDFMRAINQGLLTLPGFASGGLVSDAMERMTTGAGIAMPRIDVAPPAPAGRPLSLTIGGETFSGMSAPEDTARKLERFAARRQMVSVGRAPSWYGR